MTKSILITICLANDMVSPIKKNDPTPNPLHIGFYETTRLLGGDWKNGPLINFLKSCYKKEAQNLNIINVRDWHSLNDPLQKHELSKYGLHCIENTWGAEFIWENKSILPDKGNAYSVNSKKILTASEPTFSKTLLKVIGNTKKDDIRIGIIGVLTNIKVAEMAIALQGFYDINEIAVCSALTASNNIRRHFQGLEDLSNFYGVTVFDSIRQFGNWLNLKTKTSIKIEPFDKPYIEFVDKSYLSAGEKRVTEYLFRGCKSIRAKELSGGYSRAKVFLINSIERNGYVQVPTVLKLDNMERIGKERVGFEKLQYILGPHVPQILASIETEKGAGIRYSFAAMHQKSNPKTFKEFFVSLDGKNKKDTELLSKNMNVLFDEIFEPLYSNWTLDQKQLWKANTFNVGYIRYVASDMKKVLGYLPNNDSISIDGVGTFYNPMLFYTKKNINSKLFEPVSYVRQSLAHGDLNAGNIILDDYSNMWLIDFFNSDYDYHIIQDIVKLENDLKFIHTPISSVKDLSQLVRFERLLMDQKKLSDPLKKLPKDLGKNRNITRLYKAVKILRQFAFKISADNNMYNYRVPQLRYSAHNLRFEESELMQKKYALVSTSMLAEYFLKNE
jgi:hypothetical protein